MRKLAATLLLMAAAHAALADCGKDPECDDLSAWNRFGEYTLAFSLPNVPGANADWTIHLDASENDMLIDTDHRAANGEQKKGKIGLVGGRIMLSQGLELRRGYEIDALDGPVLELRLVLSVLSRVFPKGPDSVQGTVRVDYAGKAGIKYATPSASGYMPLPWHAAGEVRRQDDGLSYDLHITAPTRPGAPMKEYTMLVSGKLAGLEGPVFDDGGSLEGWTVYGLGVQAESEGGSTKYDYGAKPQGAGRARTFADLRSLIAAENDPGKRDPAKDFTGFWKEKCDQGFGLQVMPYGRDGKYSVVFCGPGGCGDPGASRPTFITGDRHYEVVSEDEIYMRGAAGRTRFLRCTHDPHPVLK